MLVVGENFGSGSSREHVPQAMRASGVRCVVGRSFARIFHRNCINLGLLVLQVPGRRGGARASTVRIDTETGEIAHRRARATRRAPVPQFMLDTVLAGGLVRVGPPAGRAPPVEAGSRAPASRGQACAAKNVPGVDVWR